PRVRARPEQSDQHGCAALVLRRPRVSARPHQAAVSVVAAAGPEVLAVDDEVVAVDLGAALQAGEVGAGVRFGVELAPKFLAREDILQIALLLLLGAVVDQRRADDADAESVDAGRGVDARHLLGHNGLLHGSRVAAAVLLRPAHTDEAGVVELAVPLAALLDRADALAWHVRLQPAANLLAEGFVFGRIAEIHRGPSSRRPGHRVVQWPYASR